jgi:2-phosphosulfolactate phosphatase
VSEGEGALLEERVMTDPWSQDGYRCRLEWGRRGARVDAERGDALVVIDVLRFSTATVTAVQHGGIVYPCAWTDDPVAYAARIGAEAAAKRQEVPESGRFSLSPATFTAIEPGTRVVLASTK